MANWTDDDWRRADALLERALDAPVVDRDALLVGSGESDEVIARVRRMLASQGAAEARIADSVGELAAEVLEEDGHAREDLPSGSTIGPYRIVREVGRGGMGTVYLAEQDDGRIRRQVAIKVVKRGMDTDEVIRRFRREGQILARLEHPGIARLYDADVAPDGRSYLVLEYVDGEPIDVAADASRLSVNDRIRLLLDVCDAVAFAHTKLVLHRDLKPSNILVSAGGPKLLDFGIGKLLDEPSAGTRPLTEAVGSRLTPEYASPEQLGGGEVTTASDVYSLGVVSYELLTGQRPTGADTRAPSTLAPEAVVASTRQTTPSGLARRLRGDLDVILMKALHEDPTRRYPTVEAFAADLRRHLEGLPVRARPDSVGYRVRKFVTRNPIPVASGSGLGVAVLLFGVGTALQQAETARERDRANLERDRAEAVADVLEGMFTGAGALSSERIDTLSVRAFLDRNASEAIDGLDDQPVVQGTLLRILGTAQHGLGRLDEADSLLTRAVAVLTGTEGEDPRAVLEARRELGNLRQRQGRQVEARPHYEAWLASGLDLEPSEMAQVRHNIAIAMMDMGEVEEAIVLQDSTLRIHEARPDMDPVGFGAALTMRAAMAYRTGDPDAAISMSREAVERVEAADPGHPLLFAYQHNYAFLVYRGRDAPSALPLYEGLVDRYRAEIGTSVEMSQLLLNYGNVLRDVGRADDALNAQAEALELQREIFGQGHPHLTNTLDGVATTLEALGRVDEAVERYREALTISEAAFGADHPQTAVARFKLAGAQCEAGGSSRGAVLEALDHSVRVLRDAGHPALEAAERRRESCATP